MSSSTTQEESKEKKPESSPQKKQGELPFVSPLIVDLSKTDGEAQNIAKFFTSSEDAKQNKTEASLRAALGDHLSAEQKNKKIVMIYPPSKKIDIGTEKDNEESFEFIKFPEPEKKASDSSTSSLDRSGSEASLASKNPHDDLTQGQKDSIKKLYEEFGKGNLVIAILEEIQEGRTRNAYNEVIKIFKEFVDFQFRKDDQSIKPPESAQIGTEGVQNLQAASTTKANDAIAKIPKEFIQAFEEAQKGVVKNKPSAPAVLRVPGAVKVFDEAAKKEIQDFWAKKTPANGATYTAEIVSHEKIEVFKKEKDKRSKTKVLTMEPHKITIEDKTHETYVLALEQAAARFPGVKEFAFFAPAGEEKEIKAAAKAFAEKNSGYKINILSGNEEKQKEAFEKIEANAKKERWEEIAKNFKEKEKNKGTPKDDHEKNILVELLLTGRIRNAEKDNNIAYRITQNHGDSNAQQGLSFNITGSKLSADQIAALKTAATSLKLTEKTDYEIQETTLTFTQAGYTKLETAAENSPPLKHALARFEIIRVVRLGETDQDKKAKAQLISDIFSGKNSLIKIEQNSNPQKNYTLKINPESFKKYAATDHEKNNIFGVQSEDAYNDLVRIKELMSSFLTNDGAHKKEKEGLGKELDHSTQTQGIIAYMTEAEHAAILKNANANASLVLNSSSTNSM